MSAGQAVSVTTTRTTQVAELWQFSAEQYCPHCGNRGVWFEQETTLYGPGGHRHICLHCESAYQLGTRRAHDESFAQRLAALSAAASPFGAPPPPLQGEHRGIAAEAYRHYREFLAQPQTAPAGSAASAAQSPATSVQTPPSSPRRKTARQRPSPAPRRKAAIMRRKPSAS